MLIPRRRNVSKGWVNPEYNFEEYLKNFCEVHVSYDGKEYLIKFLDPNCEIYQNAPGAPFEEDYATFEEMASGTYRGIPFMEFLNNSEVV